MTLRKLLVLAFQEDAKGVIDTIEAYDRRLLSKNKMLLRIDQVYEIAELIDQDPVELVVTIIEQRCRVCGCTNLDCHQCIEKTGSPCSWVEDNLCSACA